jgi:hypothetical protein
MHVVISTGTSGKYESKNQQHIPELTATNMCHHVPVRREVCSLLVAAAACHIGEMIHSQVPQTIIKEDKM